MEIAMDNVMNPVNMSYRSEKQQANYRQVNSLNDQVLDIDERARNVRNAAGLKLFIFLRSSKSA